MEKLSRVLSDFAVEPGKMTRVRGGFLLETDGGLRMLQDYRGGTAKLAAVEALQKSLREKGFFQTDLLLRTKKGELFSKDVDGTVYVLKEWFAGQECGRDNYADLFAGMELLARLHTLTERTEFGEKTRLDTEPEDFAADGCMERQTGVVVSENLNTNFEKRIRELRHARNYLKSRRRKTDYESELSRHAEYYIERGEEALERLRATRYESLRQEAVENGAILHGAYHYHNILILSSDTGTGRTVRGGRPVAVTVNFERMAAGLQVRDVYDYIRKILEKNAWNRDLGHRLLERYRREKPLSEDEMEILGILFFFPEKYWKLINHYCNHSKSWLPGKNPEKLAALVRQEEGRIRFAEEIV